ncbi:hypothetical protein GCM10027416_19220 [Okibacterium endophyticum]
MTEATLAHKPRATSPAQGYRSTVPRLRIQRDAELTWRHPDNTPKSGAEGTFGLVSDGPCDGREGVLRAQCATR